MPNVDLEALAVERTLSGESSHCEHCQRILPEACCRITDQSAFCDHQCWEKHMRELAKSLGEAFSRETREVFLAKCESVGKQYT